MIRLLIADDHPVVRDGLAGMLASQPDMQLVGAAADGRQAVDLSASTHPDVLLLDLRMPGMDGVQVIDELRSRHPGIRILVLTTYDTDADILRAIEAGASGYLLKDAPREDLFQAIRTVARGQTYLSPAVASRLVHMVRAPADDAPSERELEVLGLVARGLSNKEIGRQLHIGEATVKSHLLHVFAKLGASDRTQAVTIALQRGLVRLER